MHFLQEPMVQYSVIQGNFIKNCLEQQESAICLPMLFSEGGHSGMEAYV